VREQLAVHRRSPDAARGQQLLALAESQGVDPTPLLEEAGLA